MVEDDPDARQILADYLQARGYEVHAAGDGAEAMKALARANPDAVLLDLMMPRVDGWEFLAYLRASSDIPVIVITARDATDDVVRALAQGADDYVVKPFKLREVEARLEAQLRRRRPASVIRAGPVTIDDRTKQVWVAGRPVSLSPREYDLLKLLASEPGRVFSTGELLERLWPQGELGSAADVKRYVRLLRTKVEEDPAHPKLVVTVRGFGYRLAG